MKVDTLKKWVRRFVALLLLSWLAYLISVFASVLSTRDQIDQPAHVEKQSELSYDDDVILDIPEVEGEYEETTWY